MASTDKPKEISKNSELIRVGNNGGPALCYSARSGVKILESDGFRFKDLNRDGKLDPYEDWRLPAEARAKDLASKMTVEQIAGLMLYSAHQNVPSKGGGMFGSATYGGKQYEDSGAAPSDLSDQQIAFLKENNIRHVLLCAVESPETAAKWSNNLQKTAEGLGMGIPVNISSDPRNGVDSSAEFNAGAGGKISMWPEPIGAAATFEPELIRKFGKIASKEYRALGIGTALSPQIDIATEPRWGRFSGTFGESPALSAELARAYCDGFQTSEGEREISDGWGYDSVNAMVKHWPGGGAGEGGRDAHYCFGKYAVYPGSNFADHQLPFVRGAFKLSGKTGKASAVMPYYTISYGQDHKNGENVGNSYSKYIISDLLREKYGYDGVVCTDWMITADCGPNVDTFSGKCWGVETLSVAERHLKAILAGVDQFGGNNEAGPVLEAYRMGAEQYGEEFMRRRFEASAVRLLKNIFRLGLFENPYLDEKETTKTVGNPEFMRAGFEAQMKSVAMIKNRASILPLKKGAKVYVPKIHTPSYPGWLGTMIPAKDEFLFNPAVAKKYFDLTDNPEEADCAIVFIRAPGALGAGRIGAGYDPEDLKRGGNGYVPISLQYRPYTAEFARAQSVAGGDPQEGFTNRSYRGKTVTTINEGDLDAVLNVRKAIGSKPLIVSLYMVGPAVLNEFEKTADAILINSGVQDDAVFELLTGGAEPSGLLPFQIPADMRTVEEQCEDRPFDMRCHTDSEGNVYDFAFGLNFSGIIGDGRVKRYKRPQR